MIEIIREEDYDNTKEKVLPKDIKQIGKPDIGDRIYVEDRVYRYLHPYDDQIEKAAYVLLGRFENYTGRQCTFIEGAIRLEEMNFDGELPVWNDNTWGYIYKKLKKDYDNMVIVGWAMDIKGQLPNLTGRIEKLHQNHFGGTHQVLFLMDTLEREEAFYSSRNNHLYRRDGFYIYYGKGIPNSLDIPEANKTEHNAESWEKHPVFETELPQKKQEDLDFQERIYFEESNQSEKETETDTFFERRSARKEGSYRKQLTEQDPKERGAVFSSPVLLAVVVCVLGFAAYQNHQKMNEMQNALAQINTVHIVTEEEETEQAEAVKVEQVKGNVEKQQDTQMVETEVVAPVVEDTSDLAETAAATNTSETSATTNTPDTAAAENSTTDADSETSSAEGNAGNTESSEEKNQTTQTAASSEVENYLKQGYYIVQKGDSMASICRKIYQTTAMMDEVCKANDIDDPDSIYAGQYLTLPN